MTDNIEKNSIMPMIALRGVVVFPDTSTNIDVGREKSKNALEKIEEGERYIFLAPQLSSAIVNPKKEDISEIGVIARVKQIFKLTGDSIKVLVTGVTRGKIVSYEEEDNLFMVEVQPIYDTVEDELRCEALLRVIKEQFAEYIKYDNKVSQDNIVAIFSENDPIKAVNVLANALLKTDTDKLEILVLGKTEDRLSRLANLIEREIEILKIEKEIALKVRQQVDKSQKEYYLREQMKAISEELGEGEDEGEEYREKISALKIKDTDTLEKIDKEISRLMKMPQNSPDAAIIRNYLDWILELPWNKTTKENRDIEKAKRILDEDHYGLEKVKERILEFLSVHILSKKMNGNILCLVGPPGVGKTSIAKSIARAVNRNFVRMSLGGVRDEAEIRGHRRTYVGAMPGRIIYNMRNAKSTNPLFLLDEIDKMASDFRGDPASALLEVLDPSINANFRDHFLEIPYDLSNVFFLTTANSLEEIPEPLLDRMEIIELSGYTLAEKLEIAKKYLIPRKAKENGLIGKDIIFTDNALCDIVEKYTRESGVRNLEREISNVYRKIALNFMLDKSILDKKLVIDKNVDKYLGVARFLTDSKNASDEIGAATGLAWTSVGGTTLTIEVSLMNGKGDIILTGKLGDVMKESARAAISYIHSKAEEFKIEERLFKEKDIHIHVPEGATPKDGPSAGITMATAILSAMTERAVDKNVAMTGEITLRGKVLPIGGLKEKVLAASRIGIKKIIIPKENEKDLVEIPQNVKDKIKFVAVSDVHEVFKNAIKGLDK